MSDFNNYKLFKNVGIRSSDNKLIVMNVNKSNNVSFYSSDGGTNNIDVMSINSIINKSQNEDLNLSSLNGTTINPVITINNNHNDCRINTNLNVSGNINVNGNLNIIGNAIINTRLDIGTTGSTVHTNSILDINGQTTIRGHILPSQNEAFDLGNAQYKIRHLFLSNNSLWIGDKHKIDVTDGTIKFRKRKTTAIPTSILAINGGDTEEQIKTYIKDKFGHSENPAISDIKLEEWHSYAQSIQPGIKIEDIFKPGETGDWDENDTTMDKLVIKNNLDVSGNISTTGTLSAATGSTIGTLTLANGSITDSNGAISFGNENLSTTGTLSAATCSFNKVVVKNNLDVSGNLNINNNLNIINRVSIGTDKPSEASDTTDTYKLLVYDNTNTNGSFIRIESDTGINGIPSGIEFINSAYKSDNSSANETYSSGRIISKWPAGANGNYTESIVQIQNAKTGGPPSGWVDALTCRNGNVGIGTNNPQQLLDVYGNSEIKGGVKIKPGGASLHLYEANQTGATFLKLEAAGSNNDAKVAPCIIEFYTNCGGQSSGNRWDYATRTTFSSGRIISTWDEISSLWSDSMVKIQNATSNTTFTDTLTCRNGSIGIGTTYPDLDENSEADIKIGNNMLIKSKEVGTSLRPYVTGGVGNVNAPGIYYNGGSHYLVIDHCGDSQTNSAIWFRQYASRMYFYCNEGRSGTHDAVFDFRTRASSAQGSWTLSIKGDNTAVSSNATNSLSDDRLKINEELITNATFTILKLRPQKYDFYTNKEKTKTTLQNGLIAQEIYYECPEIRHLVRVPDDFKEIDNPESLNFDDIKNDPNYSNWGTEYASVSYTGFIPLLIRGFQEQQNEINTLKTANAELTSIIDKLKTANSFEEFKQTF